MRRDKGNVPLGAILVVVGGFLMLRNFMTLRGELLLVFIGAGFVVSYFLSGRRAALLVPGTIFMALGAFTYLQQVRFWRSNASPGWFFLLLGLSFAAVFVIDSFGRLEPTVWPLYPAAALCLAGFLALSIETFPALYKGWVRDLWPALLILLGVMVLMRPRRQG